MKPVAIFRHVHGEGPGYFATYLERHSIAHRLIAIDAGDAVPRDARKFAGLVFMGGPMSVNDDLPWIGQSLELIRDAVRADVPLLGHCLGGQLMAKALGGKVGANPRKEIGWGQVRVEDNEVARAWLGELPAFESFHWHGETFSIPPGGTRVLSNEHCANQGFAIGKHLGLQCHVEMTEDMVRLWCKNGRAEIEASSSSPAVQAPPEMLRDLEARLDALHKVADRIYDRWREGLARG
jgi:GMP synthase-like glutamine amidotransferase